MGHDLRRALREALGTEITGLQRAVALEIADDCRDATRLSFVSLADLVVWTGAKDEAVVRNALKRLAAAGWEFRVPIGKGKDGRVLYAVPGKRMTFRVPDFEGGAVATPCEPKGEQGLLQGVAVAHSEGAPAHSEGAGATPFSSVPSYPSSHLSVPQQLIRAANVVAVEEEETFINWLKDQHHPKTNGWWRKVFDNGDLPSHAEAWRAAIPAQRPAPPGETCDRCRESLPEPGWVEHWDEQAQRDILIRCTHQAEAA